jgi:3-hydroxyisobutyrate dehydrogenase-like beta-hydroxyacid dehydrogenase
MTSVTVLGLGPMGQALSAALLDAGHSVTVWNRTESKAAALRARGATVASTPERAVAASEVTLINVVDHDAVDYVLDAAGGAVDSRTIVGLSSDTPDRARQTAKLVEDRGGRYLDGAIMTPTTTIGTPSASILFAGPQSLFDAHGQVFTTLGTASWLGEDIGRAAAFDMSLLDLFWTSVSGFMHAVNVARANGITPGELLPHARGIVDILPPIFEELAERIEADRHVDSSAPVSSVAASVRHLIAASHDAGVDAGALEAFRRYTDTAVDNGHGGEEISRIASAMTRG